MRSRAFLRGLAVASLAVLLLLVASQAGPFADETAADPPETLQPDLQTLPPRDFSIVVSNPGRKGERRLRFDNRVWNAGLGPVETYPVSEDCDGDGNNRNDRMAVQRIYGDTNVNGEFDRGDAVVTEHQVGCMVFHPRHNHWHLEKFARYDLYAMDGTAVVGPPVASSEKVSFCMIDTFNAPGGPLPGEPVNPYYRQCARDAVYGISVGWGDEYNSGLADQWIVINGIDNGDYCVVSTANPLGNGVTGLLESDYSNNVAGVRINITGNTVTPTNPTDSCIP